MTVRKLKRVVHVVPALFGAGGAFGGAERYALELARAMSLRLPTTLLTFGAKATARHEGALNIIVLRNWVHFRRFKFDPINPMMLRTLREADIIHYHQTHTMMSSLALVFARLVNKPIFTTHLGGSGFALHHYVDVGNWYQGHLHISEFSKKTISSPSIEPSKSRVIWGGVDTNKFCPAPDVKRTGEVVYVGRLLPHKGINYLVDAVGNDIPLVLLGSRWTYAQRFYELLKQRSGANVTFRENCEDGDIINACRTASCVVLPSVHTTVFGEHYAIPELLGQTLLEAMSCGTPVICSDIGSLPEVVEDRVTGFVVPPNDSRALRDRIEWIRSHPSEAKKMGTAARERVLRLFSWEEVVRRCCDAYGISEFKTGG